MKYLKWLPLLGVFIITLVVIFIHLDYSLPTFDVKKEESIDYSKVKEIIDLLADEEKKSTAQNELNKLYEGKTKDDIYYLASARITMETDHDINGLYNLDQVKNRNLDYYNLRIRATAGEFFTQGKVPDRLLSTSLEAASKYADNIDYQLLAGKLYYDKNNYTASLYYLDKALGIDENNVDANYYYALSIYLLGEQEEGINYMKKAQSLYKGEDKAFKKAMKDYLEIMKEGKR
jgi:tetratricopeptide (TPR) repeat protein